MTQEQKDLLLKDLCARLPYKLYVEDEYGDILCLDYTDLHFENYFNAILEGNVKPYLFPLSSMTEEQYDEFEKIVSDDYLENIQITKEMRERVDFITHFPIYCPNVIDWFNKNHFDYRGLIPKDLAIDATGLNIY